MDPCGVFSSQSTAQISGSRVYVWARGYRLAKERETEWFRLSGLVARLGLDSEARIANRPDQR